MIVRSKTSWINTLFTIVLLLYTYNNNIRNQKNDLNVFFMVYQFILSSQTIEMQVKSHATFDQLLT